MCIYTLIIAFLCTRGYYIHIDNKVVDVVETIVGGIVGFICILCWVTALMEIVEIKDSCDDYAKYRGKTTNDRRSTSIDEIISLVENNDIIEIEIISDKKVVKVGSSAVSDMGESRFSDKRFYIGDKEIIQLNDFRRELEMYSTDGYYQVALIDGVSPKDYF